MMKAEYHSALRQCCGAMDRRHPSLQRVWSRREHRECLMRANPWSPAPSRADVGSTDTRVCYVLCTAYVRPVATPRASDAHACRAIFTPSSRKSPRRPRTRAAALICLSAGLPEGPARENAVSVRLTPSAKSERRSLDAITGSAFGE